MKKSKTALRCSLVMSILALLMCVSMLIGTTFAWFTDTATTAVNKIQAGTLDVDLVDKDGKTLVGTGLAWIKADGAPEGESVLWEPGVSYKATEVYVMNKGNLALKYELKITGVTGSAKLLEAIDFTINGTDITSFSGTLQPGTKSAALVLEGHMHEDAGNTYQGLTLDGISITVYATQFESEYDSFNNTYDANASDGKGGMTDLVPTSAVADVNKDGDTVVKDAESNYNVKVTVPAAALADGATNINVTVTPKDAPDANVTVASGDVAQTFDVDVTGIKADNTENIAVELFVGKNRENLKLYHNSTEITDKTYDASTGIVKFNTTSFSPYTVTFTNNWKSYAADSFATAVDSTNKVVYIADAAELALFANEVNGGKNYAGYTVNLTQNIDLGGRSWTPIAGFAGNFDGNNKTISNLYISKPGTWNAAFFASCTDSASIKNVVFNNATVIGGHCASVVNGGNGNNEAVMDNIAVTGTIKVTGGWYTGIILGKGYTTVTNCTVNAAEGSYIKCNNGGYVAGIVGFMGEGSCKIDNCSVSNMLIEGSWNGIGGICGILHYGNTITNCTVTNTTVHQNTAEAGETGRCAMIAGTYLTSEGCTETLTGCKFIGGKVYDDTTDYTGTELWIGGPWGGSQPNVGTVNVSGNTYTPAN